MMRTFRVVVVRLGNTLSHFNISISQYLGFQMLAFIVLNGRYIDKLSHRVFEM